MKDNGFDAALGTMPRASGSRRRFMAALAGLPAMAAGTARAAQGQPEFPTRPIRVVVPYGPGTGTDALARMLSVNMPALLGQSMVVENRAGGSAMIGSEAVARSAADGYTLLLAGDQVMCLNPALYQRMPYDPTRDFAPVAGLTVHPLVLVVTPGLPVRSVAELVALAKAQPGRVSYATTGIGTTPHILTELFQRDAGISLTHVPYNSGAQLISDILSGTVGAWFYPYQQLKPHLEAGKLRALAIASDQRVAWAPDLPTMAELGYPRLTLASWLAVYAPAGTPPDRLARVSEALHRALVSTEVASLLDAGGINIAYRPPADLASFTATELVRSREAVQLSGARIE